MQNDSYEKQKLHLQKSRVYVATKVAYRSGKVELRPAKVQSLEVGFVKLLWCPNSFQGQR